MVGIPVRRVVTGSRSPIRSCRASEFTPTHQKATTTDGILVDEEIVDGGTIASYEWKGRAIVPTEVEISVAVGSTPVVRGRGTFTVHPRTDPEWTGLRLPLPAPTPEYVAVPFLPVNPFLRDSSLVAPEGNLGRYVQVMTHDALVVTSGPNSNTLFFYRPSSIKPPLHVYVHSWLEASSDFYRRQRGNPNVVMESGLCTGRDIARLRQNVVAHEMKHYTEDKAYFDSVDVLKRIETAHIPFFKWTLVGTAEYETAKTNAVNAALKTAYDDQWNAIVSVAVNRDYPVDTPNCKRQ